MLQKKSFGAKPRTPPKSNIKQQSRSIPSAKNCAGVPQALSGRLEDDSKGRQDVARWSKAPHRRPKTHPRRTQSGSRGFQDAKFIVLLWFFGGKNGTKIDPKTDLTQKSLQAKKHDFPCIIFKKNQVRGTVFETKIHYKKN